MLLSAEEPVNTDDSLILLQLSITHTQEGWLSERLAGVRGGD